MSGNGKHREDCVYSRKKREVLPRSSQSLNELPSDAPVVQMVSSKSEGDTSTALLLNTFYNANASRLLAFNPDSSIQMGSSQQRYQTFSMSTSGAPQSQQYFVPANKAVVPAATGNMSAYQIRSPTSSLPQGVVMAGSPSSLAEEALRKRELRLMKNREAAKECRRRKREYVRCLEARVNVLELQNKSLVSELQNMKAMYAGKSS